MPLRFPRAHARSCLFALALTICPALAPGARAQAVLGYGEDATAAPYGAIRVRLSNDWHRSRQIGSASDTIFDSDRQFRPTTVGLELGALRRVTIGVDAPWVSTKVITFISSQHRQGLVLDTLLDTSHNGWGNIDAYVKVVWLGEPGQQERLAPRGGVHIRSAIVGGALAGTGVLGNPADPFGLGTSDRARALLARSATDLTIGNHFFASFVARYEKPLSDQVLVAVRPPSDPFTRDVVPFTAQRKLGAQYELELTPRFQLGRYFSVGAQYRYHRGAQDHYQGQLTTNVNGTPVTLDASTLDAGTEVTEQRAGFGVVYSAVDAYTRHHSRIPVEVTFEHSKVVSISGNRPKDSETMISVRIFRRLWGAEFASAPAAPKPAPPPPTAP